jgi:hypothetical protein
MTIGGALVILGAVIALLVNFTIGIVLLLIGGILMLIGR